MKLQILLLLSLLYLVSCAPVHNARGDYSLRKDNHAILKDQMSDSLIQSIQDRHVPRSNRVIRSKKEALEFAKTVFQKKYGHEDDIEARIFTTHLVKGYWIVRGLLPRGFNGGTLVSVIDSETGELFCTFIWR